MSKTRYVLITPARNEEAYIEKTIESVTGQSILPQKWVIVSDGSTDRTDEIVAKYAANNDFIQHLRIPEHSERDFGLKVDAFYAGFEQLKEVEYDFLANLDADVSFGPNYFEYLLEKFEQNPKLGLAGGLVVEVCNGKHVQNITLINRSVGGQTQLFRREVFEKIGGYVAINGGGEDMVADYSTRRYGWQVRTFPENKIFHHRQMGTEDKSIWRARMLQGVRDYMVGYHPLYETAKCLRRIVEKPYVIGSALWLAGYLGAAVRRYERPVPSDVVRYIRKDQLGLLLKPFSILGFWKKRGANNIAETA